ncbi:MAG: hypothetical protein A2157_09300 [Deltaproteobacteria bacterium RBG_16_47_11]|nr:MAG: hypothetical protein A2157_09300 [Deltaproteobacteria bacterium RBG_16_47_11]
MANRFKILLTGSNFDIQHIFSRGQNADEFFVIRARGMISHIEVQDHFVIWQDLRINIPPPFIGLFFVCVIFKRNKKSIA